MAVGTYDHSLEEKSGANVSWGAILAGMVISLGIWLMLYVGGLALGLVSVDPNDTGSLKGAGIGSGIWALIAPLIALFVGGFAAARLSALRHKGNAALHGTVLWGITTIIGFMLIASVVSSLVGGAFKLGGQAVSSAASAGASSGGGALKSLGIDANDMLAPINRQLQEQGKPTVTPDQLEASVKDVAGTAVREGRFDRQLLTSSIAQNTRLDQQDANQLAGQIEQKFNEQSGGLQQKAQAAGQGAMKAADTTGKVMLGVFGLMLLGLISSILGAITGRLDGRDHDVRRRASSPIVTPAGSSVETRTPVSHVTTTGLEPPPRVQ